MRDKGPEQDMDIFLKLDCIDIATHTPHQLVVVMYQIVDCQPQKQSKEEKEDDEEE